MASPSTRRAFDPVAACDLRRSRGRDLSDMIASHAQWLLPDDRALMLAVYRDGLQANDIAQLRGEPVRTIRRRIRLLIQRLPDPMYTFVLGHREQWPPTRRRVATACFLQGRSFRQSAEHLHVSLYTVRRNVEAVRLLAERAGGER